MKKKHLWLIAVSVLVVVVFFCLNHIAALFCDPSYRIHRISFEDYEDLGEAYIYMDEPEYSSDESNISELLTFNGWAFAESDDTETEKEVRLIFKGKKGAYITEKAGMRMSTIQYSLSGWKKVPEKNNNFGLYCSTLTLPNDVYEIYAYINENGEDMGLVNTGETFKKEGVKLYDYTAGVMCEDVDPTEATQMFSDGWFGIYYENDCVSVEGWEAADQVESESIDYYVSYVGDNDEIVTIAVPNMYRTNIAEHLGDVMYMGSEFEGALAYEQLPDAQGYIYILGSYGDQLFASDGYRYNIDNTVEGGRVPVLPQEQLAQPVEPFVAVTQMDGAKSDINEIEISGGYISLRGWAFVEGQNADAQTVILERLDGLTTELQYRMQSSERPDVAEVFESEDYLCAGFSAFVPRESIPEGENKIRLLVQNGDDIWTSKTYTIARAGNTIEIQEQE